MTKGKKKLFLDKETLYKALMLRRAGWGFEPIALIYSCDRTSVRDQARKYSILPELRVFNPQQVAIRIMTELNMVESSTEWAEVEGERICLGKSYADYIKQGR